MLNISTFGTVPLTMLYPKKGLHAPDNIVVFLSAAALTGICWAISDSGAR